MNPLTNSTDTRRIPETPNLNENRRYNNPWNLDIRWPRGATAVHREHHSTTLAATLRRLVRLRLRPLKCVAAYVHAWAITNHAGRIMVLMHSYTHNTSQDDPWEREADNLTYFHQLATNGYARSASISCSARRRILIV